MHAWQRSKELIASGDQAIVILDELTYVINYGFVPLDEVLAALRDRPAYVHVIISGRNAPEELLAIADLVTEMKSIKHPFDKGVRAQPGLDF